MNKLKVACLLVGLVFSLAMCGGLITQQMVAAQEEEVQEEEVELNCKYPIRSGPSNTIFGFSVELSYSGGEQPLLFELSAEGPDGWQVVIYESVTTNKEIPAIQLDPDKTYPETIVVNAMAPYWSFPEPGDYDITLKVASGEITGNLDLTARISASYDYSVETEDERLNIKATAGEESHLTIIITNLGTAPLDKITFRSTKPTAIANEAWSVTFSPDKIEDLKPYDEQQVQVVIKPPPKSIAGDYMTTLSFNSDPAAATAPPELDIRVTVGTATRWGWIGAGIVVAVIVGLFFGFRQLGRR